VEILEHLDVEAIELLGRFRVRIVSPSLSSRKTLPVIVA